MNNVEITASGGGADGMPLVASRRSNALRLPHVAMANSTTQKWPKFFARSDSRPCARHDDSKATTFRHGGALIYFRRTPNRQTGRERRVTAAPSSSTHLMADQVLHI